MSISSGEPQLPIDWSNPANFKYAIKVDNRADLARSLYHRDGTPTAYSSIEFDAWEFGARRDRRLSFRRRMWVAVLVTVLLSPALLLATDASPGAFLVVLAAVLGVGVCWAFVTAENKYGLTAVEHHKAEARRMAMLDDAELDEIRQADRLAARTQTAARLGVGAVKLWAGLPD